MTKRKQASTWILARVPTWVADEWFDDSKYANNSTLGHITGDLAKITNLKKRKLDPELLKGHESTLTIEKGSGQINLEIPKQLTIKLQDKTEKKLFKHGRYCHDKTTIRTQLIFTSVNEFTAGHTVLAPADFKEDENWVEGKIVGHLPEDRVQIQLKNRKIVERKKDQIQLTMESRQKAQACKPHGMIENTVHMKPMMNKEYANWVKKKSEKKKKVRHTIPRAQRTYTDKLLAIRKRRERDADKEKRKGPKKGPRVRQTDDIYKNLILRAFDEHKFLDKNSLTNITGEPWTFLSNLVGQMCNYIQGGEYKKHYQLKEEYRV